MDSLNQFPLPSEVSTTMAAYARLVDGTLPERIRGLYLTGSVAFGDYHPGQSDIDFVAVCDTELQPHEVDLLRRVHHELRRKVRAPQLDGVYLTWRALAAAPVGLSAPYCLRGQFEASGDFAINPVTWSTLHRHPVPLRGPVTPLVHHDDDLLRGWCRENLQSHWRTYVHMARGFTVHRLCSLMREPIAWGVLGVARPHATIRSGEMISKSSAGAYALDVFPSRFSRIIRQALADRSGTGRSYYRNIFERRRDLLAVMDYAISGGGGGE